jgi:hypothetical protein
MKSSSLEASPDATVAQFPFGGSQPHLPARRPRLTPAGAASVRRVPPQPLPAAANAFDAGEGAACIARARGGRRKRRESGVGGTNTFGAKGSGIGRFQQKASRINRRGVPDSLTLGFWQAILRGGLGAGRHARAIPSRPGPLARSRGRRRRDRGLRPSLVGSGRATLPRVTSRCAPIGRGARRRRWNRPPRWLPRRVPGPCIVVRRFASPRGRLRRRERV